MGFSKYWTFSLTPFWRRLLWGFCTESKRIWLGRKAATLLAMMGEGFSRFGVAAWALLFLVQDEVTEAAQTHFFSLWQALT